MMCAKSTLVHNGQVFVVFRRRKPLH